MRGLFAFTNSATSETRLCEFHVGLAICRRTLQRLRRDDPPFEDMPAIPIGDVPADEVRLGLHFLIRAAVHMMAGPTPDTVTADRYLMAFSELSKVRFATVTIVPQDHGMGIHLLPLDESDIDAARAFLMGDLNGNRLLH